MGVELRVTVVRNWLHSWWMELLHCGCGADAWLPCCIAKPGPGIAALPLSTGDVDQGLPLPPANFAALRTRDSTAYLIEPCRRVGLASWRLAGFSPEEAPGEAEGAEGRARALFDLVLPTHPSFGWFYLAFVEKTMARNQEDDGTHNQGFFAVSPNATSPVIDQHLGFVCDQLLQLASSPRGGMPGWTLADRLREFDGGLAMFEMNFYSGAAVRWAVPVRYGWHGCIFGALADIAALASSSYGGQAGLLPGVAVAPACPHFEEAELYLAGAGEAPQEEQINVVQQIANGCLRMANVYASGADRRMALIRDARGLFARLGAMHSSSVQDFGAGRLKRRWSPPTLIGAGLSRSPAVRAAGARGAVGADSANSAGDTSGARGWRLKACGEAGGAVPRYRLAIGAEAFLLGASLVEGYVELALYLASSCGVANCTVPLVDAVSSMSLPHASLVGWRCAFQGGPREPAAATVLSYYGTEVVVRCPVPTQAGFGGTPMHLSLVPGNPAPQARGWALEGLHLCTDDTVAAADGGGASRAAASVVAIPRRWRLVLCGQPMYGIRGREDELRQWLEYHRREVGVEHFFLYDNDGSLADGLAPYIAEGLVSYIKGWPGVFSPAMEAVHNEGVAEFREGRPKERYPSALSTQAETHCLFQARYAADYALFLHSLDAYLAFPLATAADRPETAYSEGGGAASGGSTDTGGLRELMTGFDRSGARETLASVAFRYVSYGGPPRGPPRRGADLDGGLLNIERFEHRGQQQIVKWSMDTFDANVDSWLEAVQPLVVPENVVSVVGSHWARGRPGTIHVEVDMEEARIHHYVDLLKQRCRQCTVLDPALRGPAARLRQRMNDLAAGARLSDL